MTPSRACDCGACTGVEQATPVAIDNRPGLRAIAYRSGRHGDFLGSMRASLSSPLALAGLRTRAKDDFSIALLDAWAASLDVLTFYQERYQNEAFLGTATERRSLVELGRTLGYELAPAIASSTFLAFALETAAGSPKRVTIPKGARALSIPEGTEPPQPFETDEDIEARPEWNEIPLVRTQPAKIDARSVRVLGLRGEIRAGDVILLSSDRFVVLTSAVPDPATGTTLLSWEGDVTVTDAAPKVHWMRRRAAVFGAMAVDFRMLPDATKKAFIHPDTTEPSKVSDWPSFLLSKIAGKDSLPLDGVYSKVTPGSRVVVRSGGAPLIATVSQARTQSVSAFGLTQQVTVLELSPKDLTTFETSIRSITVHCESEELPLAPARDATSLAGVKTLRLAASGFDLPKGRRVLITGTDKDGRKLAEPAIVAGTVSDGANTKLELETAVRGGFTVATAAVHANVAQATHGERAPAEVLGSGSATASYQRFALRQAPLAHRSAPNARGYSADLEVRVEDVLWNQVESFRDAGPKDRVFALRIDDDHTARVEFGDGVGGARLPSGVENVRAAYRKGGGALGNAAQGAISLLYAPPPGVRSVTNPIAASGGIDPETMEEARAAVGRTVLALDRIVSLQDYVSFALGYRTITKARADWVWAHDRRAVLLTVAGVGGAQVVPDGAVEKALREAIARASDPHVPVRIDSYRAVPFALNLKVRARDGHDPATVVSATARALAAAFSFERRELGKNLAASEVIEVATRAEGVAWVDLDGFYRVPDKLTLSGYPSYLPCHAPASGDLASAAKACELLILDPAACAISTIGGP